MALFANNSFSAPWIEPTTVGSRTGGAPGSDLGQAPIQPPGYNTEEVPPTSYNAPTDSTSMMMGGTRNQGRTTGGTTQNPTPTETSPWDPAPSPTALPDPGQMQFPPPTGGTPYTGSTPLPGTPEYYTYLMNKTKADARAATVPPPGQSQPPGSIPKTNPYGSNPYADSPGYTGPYGPGGYNPQTFASQQTAQQIAQQYGGTVVSGADTSLLSAPGSPFQTNQPQYMVRLANGTVIDPAAIARVYSGAEGQQGGLTNYQQALVQDILGGSTGAALNQPGFNGVNQSFPTGTPINTGGGVQQNTGGYAQPAGVASQLAGSGATQQIPNQQFNPLNVGTQYPTNSPYGGNTNGQVPGVSTTNTGQPTPSNSTTGIDWSNLNAQTLPIALQMLQAYSQLGSGAGNPTGVNSNGQLGQILQMLLSGLAGDQSLYTRRRQYPQFA